MPRATGGITFRITLLITLCQAVFKNFSDPVKAIAETYSVPKPKGTVVIVDMRRDASNEEIEQEVRDMRLGFINEFVVRWTFKQMLVKSAYSVADMETMISQTPFVKGTFDTDGIGFQVWLAK
jgi:ubiquinone/menaquinone biosynthesis C-methylase UbiE